MNKSTPSTQDLIQSVQRQVKKYRSIEKTHTTIKSCKIGTHFDGIQQQNWPGWKFTCSRIPHCVFDSHIHIRPIKLSNKTGGRLDRTRICREIEFGSPRGAIHLARTARCFYHSDQGAQSELPEGAKSRVLRWKDHIHVCVQRHWMDKANTEKCSHNAKEVAAHATKFKPGHWCFLWPGSECTYWNGNSNEPQGQWGYCRIAASWHIQVSHFPPDIPATEPLSLGRLRFPRYFEQPRPSWQAMYCSFTKRICQWHEIENQILTRRTGVDEEQIDLEPEQLTLITQKQQPLTQARGDSVQLTENHGTMIRRASEQAACARTVENGKFCIAHESVMDGNSSASSCWEDSEPTQSSRRQAVLTGHVKIGPVTGIEVFKYAGSLVIEVWVPTQQPGNEKSWVRISQRNWTIRTTVHTDHQDIEAVSSQWSLSCGRPRAEETGGNSPVRYKAAPTPKLIPTGVPVCAFGSWCQHKR